MDTIFTIQTITENDIDKIEEFLRKFFYQKFKDSPISKCLNISPEEGSQRTSWQSHCFVDGKSFKAITKTGEIIGVVLNRLLLKNKLQNSIETENSAATITSEKLKIILDYVKYIEDKVKLFEIYSNIDKALYIDILSVNDNYRNIGIAKQLLNKSIDYMRSENMKVCQILGTNYYLIKLCEKLEFKCIAEVLFKDYIVNGKNPIIPTEPHTSGQILIKEI